jgi:serine/threonine-protein kinase haspin
VAENCFEFEHRDLHWGNILVRKCDESSTEFVIEAKTLKVDTFNVCATIIDFSLSR